MVLSAKKRVWSVWLLWFTSISHVGLDRSSKEISRKRAELVRKIEAMHLGRNCYYMYLTKPSWCETKICLTASFFWASKAQKILGAGEQLCGKEFSGLECQVGPKRGSYFASLGWIADGTFDVRQGAERRVCHPVSLHAYHGYRGVCQATIRSADDHSLVGRPPLQLHCCCDSCQPCWESQEKVRVPNLMRFNSYCLQVGCCWVSIPWTKGFFETNWLLTIVYTIF